MDEETNHAIARFYPSWLERHHRIGQLDIVQKEMQEIIVITALVLHESSYDHKLWVAKTVTSSDCKGGREHLQKFGSKYFVERLLRRRTSFEICILY